ncbi:NAD(P)-binding oxidoreductase [Bradyrhizobium sp. LTSP857]|uniref:NAD(P)-dependent oxidoreductase n=1 Tax=Bradyrhizobium sp. LTSP857 TaxID=1619231 RepID=UPI0005D2204B|nr:NAD(P)-binding oxidoreductase [Bradyrhizobium sp. LTSP857]KJC42677.1 hypothetical protein UP06_23235 [Bradyrhizobium sp. LTSP857]
MKVAVLGATGSTGALVVDKLLANGHDVVAVSRSPALPRQPATRFSQENGDLTDTGFVSKAVAGCDAVVSCIGQKRASKSLFAKRTSPPDILRRSAAATLNAIGSGSQHFVYLSAFGVGEERGRHAMLFRIILRMSSIHDAYLDHAAAEAAIRASRVGWTIIRPPGLTEKDEEMPLIDKSDRWSSFEAISKRSLARFLVECVEKRGPLKRAITIGAF